MDWIATAWHARIVQHEFDHLQVSVEKCDVMNKDAALTIDVRVRFLSLNRNVCVYVRVC